MLFRSRHHASGQSQLLERRIELTACRRDGSRLPVELTITRMRVRGAWAFIGFVRDITDRVQNERDREQLAARERSAREDAVAANLLKDEFLAALSHELRTPLNAVLGWSDMLARGVTDPARVAEIAETIRRNARAQQRLVEDMLDMSAFIAGRVKLSAKPFRIAEAITAARDVVAAAADAKGVALRLDVAPVRVMGDALRLQQVFWNLLVNAIKFTPAGGRVSVTTAIEDGEVAVTVTDTGRGIDPAFLPVVFERFRQAPEGRARGGLGLGLAIARQIVEAHGGTIHAASEGPDRGASFVVRLPLAENPAS